MDLSVIKEWILTISAAVSMLAIAVGVWLSLKEYRLKLQAERRQRESAEIESEVRLQRLFAELMMTANGRSGYSVSEKAVEYLLAQLKPEPGDVNLRKLNQALKDLSILTHPVGSASQDAAIAALASLTKRHEILRAPGLRALESLIHPVTSPVAERYYKEVTEYFCRKGITKEL